MPDRTLCHPIRPGSAGSGHQHRNVRRNQGSAKGGLEHEELHRQVRVRRYSGAATVRPVKAPIVVTKSPACCPARSDGLEPRTTCRLEQCPPPRCVPLPRITTTRSGSDRSGSESVLAEVLLVQTHQCGRDNSAERALPIRNGFAHVRDVLGELVIRQYAHPNLPCRRSPWPADQDLEQVADLSLRPGVLRQLTLPKGFLRPGSRTT